LSTKKSRGLGGREDSTSRWSIVACRSGTDSVSDSGDQNNELRNHDESRTTIDQRRSFMKRIRYSKYVADPAGDMSMEDLLGALSDYFLQSGFNDNFWYEMPEGEQTLDDLKRALEQALLDGEAFDEEMRDRLQQMQMEGGLEELIKQLIERLQQEDYISIDQPHDPAKNPSVGGQAGEAQQQAKFEITDKSLDFLGFKALRDLLGSLGKSNFGRHDTRDMATGIEASGASKPYEFGDTLNLDITATLSSAIQREGLGLPLNLEYRDLQVHQCEYQSSCATVLMLDCSHSMILYGEDRFTPAKKVAMALSQLIRTQYPGDSLSLVLFHDSAEEVPLSQLARVKVGPYYTNTREGLRMAQRILQRQRKDMKQIVMITDGKPSALTLEDGRIYKNAFGLDPLVVSQTLEEVSKCKRSGVLINTFMLASDYGLVQFVQKVTEMCRGKAYFTTPYTLGQYLLMDYMSRKTKTIH
jgi:Ca-activated chloride channel family protein